MKEITIKDNIKVYEFNDLSKDSKKKAVFDLIEFWIENRVYDKGNKGNFEKAIDAAASNRTPWFESLYIYDYCKDEITKELGDPYILYDKNGKVLPITHFIKNNKVIKSTITLTEDIEVEIVFGNEIKEMM